MLGDEHLVPGEQHVGVRPPLLQRRVLRMVIEGVVVGKAILAGDARKAFPSFDRVAGHGSLPGMIPRETGGPSLECEARCASHGGQSVAGFPRLWRGPR